MIQVRQLTEEDSIVDLTSLLHRAYARLSAMGLNYTAVDQAPDVTARRIHGGVCFVATSLDDIVGTIVVQPTHVEHRCEYFTRSGVASAHQFAVEPEHQSRGVGSMLLKAVEQWAIENGYRELVMDTAEPARHLIELYGRRGYRQVASAQWPGKTYRSVILSKPLTPNP